MVNLGHNLTVDDLIVEYTMYKVKNDYEPSFSVSEFIDFLHYFESNIEVEDSLYDGEELFRRFFERKSNFDWSNNNPHLEMVCNQEIGEYLIKANYRLNAYDNSVINTYFMTRTEVEKIRKVIADYLENHPKRQIDPSIEINSDNLLVGKYIATEIIENIWKSYVETEVSKHRWPKQCSDITDYLFKMDLATIIGLKSIREDLITFYEVISKRLAILYQQDENLKISSHSNDYLANSNYRVLVSGYEEMFNSTFGTYKNSLEIDLEKQTFTERHESEDFYLYDDESEIKTNIITIGNDKAKKLVLTIENCK